MPYAAMLHDERLMTSANIIFLEFFSSLCKGFPLKSNRKYKIRMREIIANRAIVIFKLSIHMQSLSPGPAATNDGQRVGTDRTWACIKQHKHPL